MSDATLPPLRSSSVVDMPTLDRSESSSSESDALSVPGNSQDAANKEDPMEGGNGEKKKRKRTSPEDQATLEIEYKRNPKPDKTARLEIVKCVAMGEKEVQIWFQNRRQNTRRKSRPLLPHEIAAFGLGGMAALSSDPISSSVFGSSQSGSQAPSPQVEQVITSQSLLNQLRAAATNTLRSTVSMPEGKSAAENCQPTITPLNPLKDSQSPPATQDTVFSLSQPLSQPTPVLGYLSNRRHVSHSFSTPTSSQPMFSTPSFPGPTQPESCPERIFSSESATPSSSQVRLSMSIDGKAELVPAEFSSPQKPPDARPLSSNSIFPPRRPGGLQRSYSAFQFGTTRNTTSPTVPLIPRLPSGRSRDTRTWEFCCDADARDELTKQAENESSGSAIAAISLIRSTSNALKANSNKRNTPAPKRDNKQGKKARLGRSTSSVARLQSTGSDYAIETPTLAKISSGDSDKENWSPHDATGNIQSRRRPLPSGPAKSSSRRRILGNAVSSGSLLDGPKSTRSAMPGHEIFEDNPDEPVDLEVEKFMRGEVSPSKKGDLDCIQGLLSLSQGNWR